LLCANVLEAHRAHLAGPYPRACRYFMSAMKGKKAPPKPGAEGGASSGLTGATTATVPPAHPPRSRHATWHAAIALLQQLHIPARHTAAVQRCLWSVRGPGRRSCCSLLSDLPEKRSCPAGHALAANPPLWLCAPLSGVDSTSAASSDYLYPAFTKGELVDSYLFLSERSHFPGQSAPLRIPLQQAPPPRPEFLPR
jgi:hypothetical protein